MLYSINLTYGKTVSSYEKMGKDRISKVIEKAHYTFLSWKETSFRFRS